LVKRNRCGPTCGEEKVNLILHNLFTIMEIYAKTRGKYFRGG